MIDTTTTPAGVTGGGGGGGGHVFETLATTRDAVHELLVKHIAGNDPSGVLLVIETCDAAGWVHDLALALKSFSSAAEAAARAAWPE